MRVKVALLVENDSSHDKISLQTNNELICLPPNATLIHQALDVGIIVAWKASYRRVMLPKVLQYIETVLERRHANRENEIGLNGLDQRYYANMADVRNFSALAWQQVQQEAIARCWKRPRCLPFLLRQVLPN